MPFTRSYDRRTLRPRSAPPKNPTSQAQEQKQHHQPSKSQLKSKTSSKSSLSSSSTFPSTPSRKKRKVNHAPPSPSTPETVVFSPSKLRVKFSSSASTSPTLITAATSSSPSSPSSKSSPESKRKTRVIVVGAGIAGLSAARELLHRRYDVLVLEARDRPGGRLKTCQLNLNSSSPTTTNDNSKKTAPVDLGGAFIHGINKNPIYELCKRMNLKTHPFNSSSCLLVNEMGWPIDYEEDKKVSDKFNFVLEESQKICAWNNDGEEEQHQQRQEEEVGDVEESLKVVLKALDKNGRKENGDGDDETSVKHERHNSKQDSTKSKADGKETEHNENKKEEKNETKIKQEQTTPKASNSTNNIPKEDSKQQQQQSKHLDPNITFGQIFSTLTNHHTSKYNHSEQLLYQWHTSNLEMSCGTSLDKLGQNWNEDEPFGFGGKHVILKNGFGELVQGLEDGLGGAGESCGRVKYGMEVKEIKIVSAKPTEKKTIKKEDNDVHEEEKDTAHDNKRKRRVSRRLQNKTKIESSTLESKNNDENYDNPEKNEPPSSKVLVTVIPSNNNNTTQQKEKEETEPTNLQADAIIVTLPLGILSLPPSHPQHISFYPPLPQRKQEAIQKLGFGTYNKCALSFTHIFWTQSDFIGYVGSNPGRNILFMNISVVHTKDKKPILIMVYGSKHASEVDNELKDCEVVGECLGVLRKICGKKDIPKPVDYVVTRWGMEKYSRGAFSFVPPGVKGMEEYGVMGQPIYDPLDESNDDRDEDHDSNNGEHVSHHENVVNNEVEEKEYDGIAKKNTDETKKEPSLNDVTNTTDVTKGEEEKEENKGTSESTHRSRRPIILFAGEATTSYHPSTIHGAYLSGIREAYRLDLNLEPAMNRNIEFDESFLYKRTFGVKKRKRKKGEEEEEEEEHDWEDEETNVGGSGGQQQQQLQQGGGVRQRRRREVSVLSSSQLPSQQKKQSNNRRMSMRARKPHGDTMPSDVTDGGEGSGLTKSSSFVQKQRQADEDGQRTSKFQNGHHTNISSSEYVYAEPLIKEGKAGKQSAKLGREPPFTLQEDLTILRGADTYGTTDDGWNMVRSKMMPPLLDGESKFHLQGNGVDEGDNDGMMMAKNRTNAAVKKRKRSVACLAARYQELISGKNNADDLDTEEGKEGNQDSSDAVDQNKDLKKMWNLPDGSGTWLATEKIINAAAAAFPPNASTSAVGQEESESAIGSKRKMKGDRKLSFSSATSTTSSVSSQSSLSSRRKSARKVTPKKRMNM